MANEQIIKEAIQILEDAGYTVIPPHVVVSAPDTETQGPKQTSYCYPDHVEDNSFLVIE
jgi:hypothetical protein